MATLLKVRDKFDSGYVKDALLRSTFNPTYYLSTKDYTALDWYQILRQRQTLLKLIESNIEIDFTSASTIFRLELIAFNRADTNPDVNYKLLNLSCCISNELIPALGTQYYELCRSVTTESLWQFDFKDQKHLNTFSHRMHDLICIDRYADKDHLKKEFSAYLDSVSLRHKSIGKVDGKRTRGKFSLDWSYENFSNARLKKILKSLNTDNFVKYNVLEYIDLTLYFLLLRLKISDERLDGLFYDDKNIEISGDKYVEKYTRHIANVCLSDSFLNEFAISIQNTPQ